MIRIGRLRRDRGVSVARPTALGNPFAIGVHGTREECLAQYRTWLPLALAESPRARRQFDRIVEIAMTSDVTLLCWCRSVDDTEPACHADIIAERVRALLG